MYLGIDVSTRGTAACVIDEACDIQRLATFRPPERLDRIQRLVWTRNQLQAFYNISEVAFIEHYAFARVTQAHYLGELGGLLRVSMYGFLPFYEINPQSMKKFVTGKGNVKKNIVLEGCFRKFGIGSETLKDDNQVDAYCLARMCHRFTCWKRVGKLLHSTQAELAVFKKIGEPMGRMPVRLAAGKA